jgi:hypothetical protein
MRVVIVCVECKKLGEKRFFSTFKSTNPKPIDVNVGVETEYPTVPGNKYHIALRGIFPGYSSNGPCSSDILSLHSDKSVLRGITSQEEEKYGQLG